MSAFATHSPIRHPLNSKIWALAWPVMLSNASVPLLGLVDTAVLGHLPSPIYLAAVALGANIFTFLFWGFSFLRMGSTGIVARALGRNSNQEIWLTFVRAIILAWLIALPLMIFGPWISDGILYLMGGSQQASHYAQTYLEVRLLSSPLILMNFVFVGVFIGLQNTRVPLIVLTISNLTNAGLDYWFVYGLGMTVKGVAWASVIGEAIGTCLYSFIFYRWCKGQNLRFNLNDIIKKQPLVELFQVNRQLFVRTMSLLFVFAFFTAMGARDSDLVLSANAVLITLLLVISNGLDGFAQAAEALVGKYLGSEQWNQLRAAIWLSGIWSFVFAVLFCGILWIDSQSILGLLTDHPSVLQTLDEYLWWLIFLPLISVWSYWLDGVYIGAALTAVMQNAMLVATFLIFLPCWYLFQSFGNHGLWLALYCFMAARTLQMLAYLGYWLRQLSNK